MLREPHLAVEARILYSILRDRAAGTPFPPYEQWLANIPSERRVRGMVLVYRKDHAEVYDAVLKWFEDAENAGYASSEPPDVFDRFVTDVPWTYSA
jgi:hypothetical protein